MFSIEVYVWKSFCSSSSELFTMYHCFQEDKFIWRPSYTIDFKSKQWYEWQSNNASTNSALQTTNLCYHMSNNIDETQCDIMFQLLKVSLMNNFPRLWYFFVIKLDFIDFSCVFVDPCNVMYYFWYCMNMTAWTASHKLNVLKGTNYH